MKKNIKLISFAAAALLAVSPVLSSSVVQAADVPVTVTNGSSAPATTQNQELQLALNVNNINSIANNSEASSLSVALSSNYGNPMAKSVQVYNASDVKDGSLVSGAKAVDKLQAGKSYVVVASDVTLSGLTANGKYTFNGKQVTADTYGNITSGYTVVSKAFTTPDTSLTGTPYFVEGNNVVTSGNVTLTQNSVNGVVSAIQAKYGVKLDGSATAEWTNLKQDVENALKAANITPDAQGNFTSAANFTVTVNASANNLKTASMVVTVTPAQSATDYSANPVIKYNNVNYDHTQNITLADNAPFNNVNVNGTVDKAAIQSAFTATVSTKDQNTLPVTVDTSKVNTSVPGNYPVTVTATNANGKTTVLTFQLTVGVKGATYKTTNDVATVYSFNGNTVTATTDQIAKGKLIPTFTTKTVNGTSYTEINSANSNQWVESSVLEASASKPATTTEKGVKKTVMATSVAYDKNGKRTGKKYYAFKSITIVNKVVKINGKTYYKVANKDEYVRVVNITGTKRTLKHNAYVYATSTRRANKKVLKKGKKVTTYGGSYKFRNGKTYYRIGKGKQYVRTSNFR